MPTPPSPRTVPDATPRARRHSPLGPTLLGAVVAAGLLVTHLVVVSGAPGQEYSLSAARALVGRSPARWLGRDLELRAEAAPCPWWGDTERARHCAGQPLVLMDFSTAGPSEPLPVARMEPDPLVTLVRDLPILGHLVPRPATLPLYQLARFRVQLQILPSGACGRSHCYQSRIISVSAEAG